MIDSYFLSFTLVSKNRALFKIAEVLVFFLGVSCS